MYGNTCSVMSTVPWITVMMSVSRARVSSSVIWHPPFASKAWEDLHFKKVPFPAAQTVPKNELHKLGMEA